MSTSLIQRLSAHRTLSSLPENEIEWVAAHGVLRRLEAGVILTPQNGYVDGLHLVLDGHFVIYVDRGAGRRKIMEWRDGDVLGVMPYSRIIASPGDVTAEEPSDVVTVYRKDMPEMIRECPELTAKLVHVMVDRARHFTSSYLHDEKLVSLGKLAAGLAHELNNPASAIARSAGALSATFLNADAAARALGSVDLTEKQAAILEKLCGACFSAGAPSLRSPLEQEDREDSIARWLKEHNADPALAEGLTETDVTFELLDQLAGSMNGQALNAALRWLAAGCAARSLVSEIHEAASRIHGLVAAIKGFTQMDRETVPERVDVGQGLANTLVVLRAKAKSKSVSLGVNVEKDLPPVNGFAGELNQVWANLLDNALDAVGVGGRVELTANHECGDVVVRVIDNGAGIPPGVRDRIFDPFFSTKAIGEGTGLGLDIVRRLVQRHNGRIEFESNPGRTEFRVILPAEEVR